MRPSFLLAGALSLLRRLLSLPAQKPVQREPDQLSKGQAA